MQPLCLNRKISNGLELLGIGQEGTIFIKVIAMLHIIFNKDVL